MSLTFNTERLVLRSLEPNDAVHLFKLNEDVEVLKYVHDVPFTNVEAAARWIGEIDKELPLGIGRWAITATDGRWIGRCSLRRQLNGEVLMGYRLLREHWNKGYASETVAALLKLAFGTHGLPFVLSKIARENIGSIRVAEKNGGVLWRDEACGHFADALMYRFDRPAAE
ncbi:MAG: GNAT family N-acetyltransferase [Flavobacteriales bacterium]|nr:GNAT family N-acetyltransferase [Flavobacteriales bacterium]